MLSRSPRKHLHAVACVPAATCAALVAILSSTPVRAADEIVLPLYDVPTPAHVTGERGFDTTSPASGPTGGSRSSAAEIPRSTARFALVEMPPEPGLPGGGYKRPHHAVGYRWQAAESWLRDHGFDAQTCYLPMVRMHTKLSASGAAGTLWVYGRCTFR